MPPLQTLENCMKMSALVVQALREFQSPLLQLPHIKEDHLRYFVTKKCQVSHQPIFKNQFSTDNC